MKNKLFFILTVLSTIFAFTLNTFAQDHTRWGLPEDAKVRFGKGGNGEIAYSPDSSKLAVASSIGVWIYDAHTGEELDLYIGHTAGVYKRSVQSGWEVAHKWKSGQHHPSVGC